MASTAAGPGQRRVAAVLLLLAAIATAALLPLTAQPGLAMPAFVPVNQTMLLVAYAAGSWVLFAQFRRDRSVPLLLAAAGMLYTAGIILLQALSVPNLLVAGRLLGAGPETTIWLWTFWHLGPPALGLAYALALRRGRPARVPPERLRLAALGGAACAVLAAAASAFAATVLLPWLPHQVTGDDYTALTTSGIGPAVQVLTLAALGAFWHATRGRPRSTLELWIAVSLALLVLDNLVTMAGGARGAVGWQAGRVIATVSAFAILWAYLTQTDALHARAEQAAEQQARAAREHERLVALVEASSELVALATPEGRILRLNEAGRRLLAPRVPEHLAEAFDGAERRRVQEELLPAAARGASWSGEARLADGAWGRPVHLDLFPVRDPVSGAPGDIGMVARDLSERLRAEERLRQAQRMEAVGQLTGGVAHDFNNLLMVVTSGFDMIRRRPDDAARVTRLAEAGLEAAERGVRLTRQLLSFARRKDLRLETVNPNALLLATEPLVRRAVGEAVRLELALDPGLHPVQIDTAEFEAAVLNLVVNARDALPPGGGRIAVSTRNAALDPAAAAALGSPDAAADNYVVAVVEDDGCGMDGATLGRAFEPFFTTKGVGKGSGLGLSHVYGFARSVGGFVEVRSAPGAGTTVEIWLPRAMPARPAASGAPATTPLRRAEAGETVLAVEDDPAVLATVVENLADLGYAVLAARDAAEALERLRGTERIDILFSDVVMPGGMNGVQLAAEASRARPGLRVLLTSGYTGEALAGTETDAMLPVLPKPYRREELARQLRLVMGQAG